MAQQAPMGAKNQLRRRFDRLVTCYDDAAMVAREVADRLLERLDFIKLQPRRILDLGAATGYTTVALQQRFPKAEIVAVDFAFNLLSQVPGENKVCAEIENLPFADNSFDLVIANLPFIFSPDILACLRESHRVLSENGFLLFTTLGPDTLQELRHSFAQVDQYQHIQAFIDMHHIGDMLLQEGFLDPVMDMERLTFAYDSVDQLLQDLRDTGSCYVGPGAYPGLMSAKHWQQVKSAYKKLCPDEIIATCEVVHGHGIKTQQQKKTDSGEVFIPIERIRRRGEKE